MLTAYSFLRIMLAVALLCLLLLYFLQHKMIYHPQPYRADYKRLMGPKDAEIHYRTSQSKQVAFYVPPRSGDSATSAPNTLWVAFGGNASLALFWMDTVDAAADENAGFLLVDYPGYGFSEGSPSPKAILESSDAAIDALANHLSTSVERLEQDLRVVGHSLGAASALQFAAKRPVTKAVLVSPFTSMREMVRHVFFKPIALLLSHHYDNDKRLEELSRAKNAPHVTILHGTDDNVIPLQMSRDLAKQFPGMVEYHEVPGADHVSILNAVPEHLN